MQNLFSDERKFSTVKYFNHNPSLSLPHHYDALFFRIRKWIKVITAIILTMEILCKSVTRFTEVFFYQNLVSCVSKWNKTSAAERNTTPFFFFYLRGEASITALRKVTVVERAFDFLFIAGLHSTAYKDSLPQNICRCRQNHLATKVNGPSGCHRRNHVWIIIFFFFPQISM